MYGEIKVQMIDKKKRCLWEKQAKHMLQLLKIGKGSAFEQNKQF